MSNIVDCLQRYINRKGPTFIVGDFNCPDIDWNWCRTPSNAISQRLYNFIMADGFVQFVDKPTHGNNILDLVLTNEPSWLESINVESPFSSSDHESIMFKVVFDHLDSASSSSPLSLRRRYLWKQGNYAAMSIYLNSFDWTQMMSIYFTPDDLWTAFCEIFNEAIELFVPSVVVRECKNNRWLRKYPAKIRTLFTRKRCLWKQLKRYHNDEKLAIRYKQLVSECRMAVRQYECRLETRLIESQNVGSFYKYVNSKLHNSSSCPLLNDANGSFVCNDQRKAEIFNCYFSSVNVEDDGKLPNFPNRTKDDVSLDMVQFTPEKIYRVVRKLRPKMTCDPEGYPPFLLKQLISVITHPMSLLFTSFFSVGSIPSSWKRAVITPIHKKGSLADPANYRPVSLTSVFGKIMERIIAADLLDYLLGNNLLNSGHHGFLSKRSTLTNLLESVNDWTIFMENKHKSRVAYVDFSRAFDSVSHQKLLIKLASYGIYGQLKKWICNFLSGRSHCTRIGNACSSFESICSGVVQGSCLGPLLFLVYINDITDGFDRQVIGKLYADDVKLYTELSTVTDEVCLQNCLDCIYQWSKTWQLAISSKKCCLIDICKKNCVYGGHCNIGRERIEMSSNVSDLGVTVDSCLKFSNHIIKITRKAHQRASLIHRCFNSRRSDLLLKAFVTYVRPILEYNSPVWSPCLKKDILLVESVQRKFTKRIPGMSGLTYFSRLKRLNLESLEVRRLRADLVTTYKIIFGLLRVSSEDFFILRCSTYLRGHSYMLEKSRNINTVRQWFFSNRIVNIWNNLPISTTDFTSLRNFKASINNDFLLCFCKANFT